MKNCPALLLIDIQNDYFPGGRMELTGAAEAAEKSANILNYFRNNQLPVVHIAHESVREGATFFLPGTEGQQIHPLVAPQEEETVITKNFPNSFLQTSLPETLRQLAVNRLVIAGMMTHMCVDATTRAAKDLGYFCTLVHDATATKDLAFAGKSASAAQVQTAFIAALTGICDEVRSTAELLKEIAC